MTLPAVTMWSDYVCPWCYVGLAELDRVRADFQLTLDWQPFLLRPETPDEGLPLPEYIRARMNRPDNPLQARAKTLGIVLRERELIPSTRKAHAAAEVARRQNTLEPFHRAVLKRYWEQGENISDWQVLRGAAVDAGLDADALALEAASPAIVTFVEQKLEEARQLGISAVPTFLINDKYVIQGAQEAALFRQAFEELGFPRTLSHRVT